MEQQFTKFDNNKLQYDLIPPSALKSLAEVLTFGLKKYPRDNWKKCEDNSRYISALYRHLESWRDGEEFDQESNISHLSHAIANLAFLIELNKNKK